MLTDYHIPLNCTVDRERGVPKYSFAICAPYADGLPGSAVLGMAAYGPHATLFSAASDLLLAAEEFDALMRQREDELGCLSDEMRAVTDQMRAAIAKARGA